MKTTPPQQDWYPASSQKMAGTEQIAQEVAKNRNGISDVGLSFAKAVGTKALPIDGVVPVAKNARIYPYARGNYLYAARNQALRPPRFLPLLRARQAWR